MTLGRMSMLRCVVTAALMVVLASCSSDSVGQDDLDAVNEELTDARDEADELAGEIDDLTGQVKEATAEREQAEAERKAAEAERDAAAAARDAAVAERDAAVAEADELRRLYDPQIQGAIAAVGQVAWDQGCAAADAAGYTGGSAPTAQAVIADAAAGIPSSIDVTELIDVDLVQQHINDCFAIAEARRVKEAATAALTSPKGDGFWTIGVEMAPGKWRSTGTADDCYWKISPDGNPDDIIDNHFGNAGGTVTLAAGQEFETDDCGLWEKVG